ncbi:MAG: PEP-CTERM sorting domain-containing protein [Aquincola sp.]|nr:PEP-CTERM sorting domain-containing protein [Aquincola sp.]
MTACPHALSVHVSRPLRWAVACAALWAAAPAVQAVVLYDPAAGSLPAAQGWLTSATSGAAAGTQTLSGGRLAIDTMGSGVVAFGNARLSPVALDGNAGYAVDFSLQVLAESHTSPNRAGFSLLLVGSDPAQSVALSFWQDRVWVPTVDASAADRFVQGEGAGFDTTAAFTDYRLQVQGGRYSVSAGGQALFSGTLQDYRSGGLPYTVPNLVFFGDDSSRGSAQVALGAISISPVPEPASALLLLAGLGVVAAFRIKRRA